MVAIGAWLPLLGMPARGWLDFSAFYAAGALAFGPQVVDLVAIATYQAAHGLPNTPFLYPPGLALAYVPFTWLPYDLAGGIHVALQSAALIAAAMLGSRVYGICLRWAVLGTLAWAPAAAGVVSGQNTGVIVLLTVVTTWGLARGSDGIAGLAIGLAAYRPQVGAALAALALWRGVWRAVAVSAAVVVGHYALGVIATGGSLDWPAQWLATVRTETANDFRSVGWQALGLPGIFGQISVGGSAPGALLGPSVIGYIIGFVVIASALKSLRVWDAQRAVALTCALALFAGPRGFTYDAALLLPALAVLVRDAAAREWPWQYRWLLAAAYGIAFLWPLGGILRVNPLALVVLAAPFVLLGRGPFRIFRYAPI